MTKLAITSTIAALLVAGCAQHEARPAFRSALRIGDRGISIPLPPPSLLEAPHQHVDVEGEIVGDDALPSGTLAVVLELEGSEEVTVEVSDDATSFVASGLPVDLTDNCIELWLESPDGAQSDHAFYQATVDPDGTSITVVPNCD